MEAKKSVRVSVVKWTGPEKPTRLKAADWTFWPSE